MEQLILEHADALRNWALYGTFLAVVIWESLGSGAPIVQPLRLRWPNNIGLAILNFFLMRWVIRISGVAIASSQPLGEWSLLGALQLPFWFAVPVALLLLDLIQYFEHRVFHALRPLWRLHLVHHSDLDFDVTTGYRHHPFELAVVSAAYFPIVAALGTPAVALVIFEFLNSSFAWFTHANARFPARFERVLRWVFVTPEMHRVHHSATPVETNSNYSMLFSFWDRMFGTYRATPEAGYDGMLRGIEVFRVARDLYMDRMLILPFLRLNRTASE